MSVCSQCMKTTADSNETDNKTIYVNISDSSIEYDIFDSGKSIVDSNTNKEYNVSSHLASIKL